MKNFEKFSLLKESPTIATDNTLSEPTHPVEQTAEGEIKMWDNEVAKIAQWVIDNRYPKSEDDKVSDWEMFVEVNKQIEEIISLKSSQATERIKELEGQNRKLKDDSDYDHMEYKRLKVQARREAIQECIDKIKSVGISTAYYVSAENKSYSITNDLEKLKELKQK